MNIKTILLSIIAVFVFNMNYAQKDIMITYDASSELHVNGIPIKGETAMETIIEHIGKPTRTEEHKSGETSHFYEEQGVVFGVRNNVVKGVGVNYNWDGDKKFPKTSFSGKLTIGEVAITKETTSENIKEIKALSLVCPMPMLCASKDESVQVKCMIGFNKDTQLTQIAFFME